MAGELSDVPRRGARTVLDFADAANSSFEAALLRLRATLGPLAKSWPAFDVALAVYWERKHPGESLSAFLARGSAPSGMAEQVGGTVDQRLGAIATTHAAGGTPIAIVIGMCMITALTALRLLPPK